MKSLKLKVLVLTSVTTLRPVFKRIIDTAGMNMQIETPSSFQQVLDSVNDTKPNFIFIDAYYGRHDATLLKKLSAISIPRDLRIMLAQGEHNLQGHHLPASLDILKKVRAAKEDGTSVIFFIDDPSPALKEEILHMGATTVWVLDSLVARP
jgi:hypothetical protein